ncbi:transposase [Streptomyces sp. NPDC048106]|uniref:IS701 family transposase n=1 Tax=Streptomyces sp. NPDC048106 TaxID=3155750 RepID=UPI003456ECEF
MMTEEPTTRDAKVTASPEPVAAFAEVLFGHLPRADQRRWARSYLQGLLAAQGRKSIRHLAAAVSASPTAPQSLHQFVNASPWDWNPVRHELRRWARERVTVRAWTLRTAVLPKRGEMSCGVHRRFVPERGRTVNCQLGLGVFASSDGEGLPVDWSLLLPGRWLEDPRLRGRARIPDPVCHQPLWAHALSLAEAAVAAGPRVPVVADLGDGPDAGSLAMVLGRRGLDFVVAVPAGLRVLPADAAPCTGPAASGEPGRPAGVLGARDFLYRRSVRSALAVHVGDPARLRPAHTRSALVRLPGTRQVFRLFTEVHPVEGSRPRVWLTNLTDRRPEQLGDLVRLQYGAHSALARLERDYGMLDFEGRSFPGWHHHMTLVSAAYTYDRLAGATAGEPVPMRASA